MNRLLFISAKLILVFVILIIGCKEVSPDVIIDAKDYEYVILKYKKYDALQKKKAVSAIYSYYQTSKDKRALLFLEDLKTNGDSAAVDLFQLVDEIKANQ
jgi:hypothetical protein